MSLVDPQVQPTVKTELRLKLPALWLVFLLLAAILLPSRVWTTLLVGLGGLFLVAALWARSLARGLRAGRQLRASWVGIGDRLWEQFEIRHDGWLPGLWVEVQDDSNVPGYRPAVVRSVGNGYIRWQQDAICRQRGQFRIGPWRIVSGDPFGIFRVTHSYPLSDEIVIHPPIHSQIPVPLPAGQSSGRVRARERSWQANINAAAVRPYQPQDPFRWIHWPQTAHSGELQVRQFDLDAAGDIWLLADMQASSQLGQGAEGTEEQAIILAASLAARALRQNRAIGFAGYGQEPRVVPPGRGEGQQWRLLRAMALVRADGQAGLDLALRDLGRLAQRGTALVIITPSNSFDWMPALWPLGQRGIRRSVILLDRPSFGGQGQTEALRSLIRQMGVSCHVIRQGELGMPAEERQTRGHWEFKVTATGRVITVRTPFD